MVVDCCLAANGASKYVWIYKDIGYTVAKQHDGHAPKPQINIADRGSCFDRNWHTWPVSKLWYNWALCNTAYIAYIILKGQVEIHLWKVVVGILRWNEFLVSVLTMDEIAADLMKVRCYHMHLEKTRRLS